MHLAFDVGGKMIDSYMDEPIFDLPDVAEFIAVNLRAFFDDSGHFAMHCVFLPIRHDRGANALLLPSLARSTMPSTIALSLF